MSGYILYIKCFKSESNIETSFSLKCYEGTINKVYGQMLINCPVPNI